MLTVLSPTKLTGDVLNIRQFAEMSVESWLHARRFFICMWKKIKQENTNETKCETNKVHDEQIIVAKLRQEKFKRWESTTIMNEKNDFFVNCYGNKFGIVYRV